MNFGKTIKSMLSYIIDRVVKLEMYVFPCFEDYLYLQVFHTTRIFN